MATVREWTGREAALLQKALRMSVRTYAAHLGVAQRTVSKWNKLGAATHPWPDTQAILDTALARADASTRERFAQLVAGADRAGPCGTAAEGVPVAEYETWAEDLERAVVSLSRQDFAFATSLLDRWLPRAHPRRLDNRGLYLYGRALTLLGDLRRLQGALADLTAAQHHYTSARSVFLELDIPRRAAQIELSMAIVTEMSGGLADAASRYATLAEDERLSVCDRTRARLWIGTASAKAGSNGHAIRIMTKAAQDFERLVEPEDWCEAQQKLALAHRGSGDLTRAMVHINAARTSGIQNSPLQRVQIDAAQGHILVTDPASRSEGQRLLGGAATHAAQYGLHHQLRSIDSIRHREENR